MEHRLRRGPTQLRMNIEKLRGPVTCEFIIIKPTLAAINEFKRTIKVLTELFL